MTKWSSNLSLLQARTFLWAKISCSKYRGFKSDSEHCLIILLWPCHFCSPISAMAKKQAWWSSTTALRNVTRAHEQWCGRLHLLEILEVDLLVWQSTSHCACPLDHRVLSSAKLDGLQRGQCCLPSPATWQMRVSYLRTSVQTNQVSTTVPAFNQATRLSPQAAKNGDWD